MNTALRMRFPPFTNEAALRSAIELICSEFGKITRLEIFLQQPSANRRCVCFLSLDSDEAEARLSSSYRLMKYANALMFLVDIDQSYRSENRGF